MKLITDNPQTIGERMLNVTFVKDGEIWLKGYGDEYQDITLINFQKRLCNNHCKNGFLFDYKNNTSSFDEVDSFYDKMFDCGFGGCKLAELYVFMIGYAELRERLKELEQKED